MSLRGRIERLREGSRPPAQPRDERERLERLEERLAHLEAMVEGVQDMAHRESVRHEEQMAALERRTQPEALARALSDDARRRGL